jgi:molecular chaperone GrpE
MTKKKFYDPDAGGEETATENTAAEEVTQGLLTQENYEDLMQKLGEAEQKSNQYWERILRMQADAENTQRRIERDVSNAHKYALEKFVAELIPIVDSLELCISNTPTDANGAVASVIEGVSLTLKMFYSALEKFGVKQVNPISEQFDPEFQQAISMQQDPAAKPGSVLAVLQKGYTLNNRLVRPALVVIAKTDD